MAVIKVKWEYVKKRKEYKISDEFWDKLVEKVEEAEMCNRIAVDPNKLILHNTDEMVDWISEHCDNEEFKERFCERRTVLGTVLTDVVMVERIFISNGYSAPIHSIDGDYVLLYKKGKDWVSAWNKPFSFKTYEVPMTDKCKLRVPLIKDNMCSVEESFEHKEERGYKKRVAWAWVDVIAENKQFVVQHLFVDEWELKSWEEYRISEDYLYKKVMNDE